MYQYTEEIPKYGHLMTIEDWLKNVACGNFTNYDGSGYYCKDGKMDCDNEVFSNPPLDATHVCWFNK